MIEIKNTIKTNSNNRKRTVGEELYLVYLKRSQGQEDEDEEQVEPIRRRRKISIGEELYSVHLRRSQGLALDLDTSELPHDAEQNNQQNDYKVEKVEANTKNIKVHAVSP
eukprot:304911_1